MKHRRAVLVVWAWAAGAAAWAQGGGHVNEIQLDNQVIGPVTDQYIQDAIERSESEGAACLVIELDTPGGLLDSARAIVKRIMNSNVPVAVYVAPSGSRAGSAGVFITLAAHVAAMAPSTNIGAAHPVELGGGENLFQKFIERQQPTVPEGPPQPKATAKPGESAPGGEPGAAESPAASKPSSEGVSKAEPPAGAEEYSNPMAEKIMNDTVAWITSIAEARGRNAEWAKKAVTLSISATETEALEQHVIDLIAVDVPDLLAKIDGRTVQIKGRPVTLKTKGAPVVAIPMNPREQFLSVITNPNVAYLLMMLGTIGLIFEFTHPGMLFPGIAGFICLLLALYSFHTLPISYAALAILAVGLILLVAEIKVMTHGLLALSGVICLILGSVMLFKSTDPLVRVSLSIILPMVATLAAIVLILVHRAMVSQLRPAVTGREGLAGLVGEAVTELNPAGLIFVHGETWSANSSRPIERGGAVRVLKMEGLRLTVEPADQPNQKGE